MANNIVLDFESRDSEIEKTIKNIKEGLDSFSVSDLDDGFSRSNEAAMGLDKTLKSVKDTLNSIKAMRTELQDTLSKSGGPKSVRNIRRKQEERLGSYQLELQDTLSDANRYSEPNRQKRLSRVIPSSQTNYKDPKIGDTASMWESRYSYKQNVSNTRAASRKDIRDASDLNRSLLGANKKIDNANASGGTISALGYAGIKRNLENARQGIFNEDGSKKIDDVQKRIAESTSNRIDARQKILNIGNNANNQHRELTSAEKDQVQKLKAQIESSEQFTKAQTDYAETLRKLNATYQQSTQKVDSIQRVAPNQGTLRGEIYKNSRRIANGMVLAPMAVAGGLAASGNNIINQEQPYTRNLGAANGTYNSRSATVLAENEGRKYGIKGSEMLAAEDAYVSGAGYQSKEDVSSAGLQTGLLAKLTGASVEDSTKLTSTYASTTDNANSKGLKDLQNVFYGSIKQAGLDKYGKSQLEALNTLQSQVSASNGGSITNSQAQNLAMMQSLFASTKDKSLQGQSGAQVMSGMDKFIRSGTENPAMQYALMNSDPSKYNGSYAGFANIITQSQKGITDPKNMKAVLNMADSFGGNDQQKSAYMSMFTGQNITAKQASSLMKLNKSGKLDEMSDKDYKNYLKQEGITNSKSDLKKQQSSEDSKYDKGQANLERAQTQMGELARRMTTLGLTTFGANSALLIFTSSLVAAAGSIARTAATRGIGDAISRGASKRTGGTSGGYTGGSRSKGDGGGRGPSGGSSGGWFSNATDRVKNSKVGQATSATYGRAKSSRVGQAIGRTAGRVRNSGFASKASSITGKTLGGIEKGASHLGRLGSKLGGAAGWIGAGLTAIDVVGQATQKGVSTKQKGKNIGGSLGSIGGGILGGVATGAAAGSVVPGIGTAAGAAVGLGGSILGSIFGGKIGSGVGGLFGGMFGQSDKSSKKKDDEATTNKKAEVERKREKNIRDDKSFVNEYNNKVGNSKKSSKSSDDDTEKVSASDEESPLLAAMKSAENSKKKGKGSATSGNSSTLTSASGNGTINVVVSGTVKHTGDVNDLSQVKTSIFGDDGAIENLLGVISGNETKRV